MHYDINNKNLMTKCVDSEGKTYYVFNEYVTVLATNGTIVQFDYDYDDSLSVPKRCTAYVL